MGKHVAFLRAINVGGHNKIRMAELRSMAERIGLEDVGTYIQSGNLWFGADRSTGDAAVVLRDAILSTFGHEVDVIVRSAEQLRAVVDRAPWGESTRERTYLMLLANPPAEARAAELHDTDFGDESVVVDGAHAWLHCANGRAQTRLDNKYLERALDTPGTTRNWRTLQKVLDAIGG